MSRDPLVAGLGALAALAALALAAPAAAQTPSSRWGTFELQVSGYRPSIDREFNGQHPYASIFGEGRGPFFRLDAAKSFDVALGELDVGAGAGFFQRTGKGLLADGTPSGDDARLRIIPTRLSATYRLNVLVDDYGIPLAPYARFSLERWYWWSLNGSGNTSDYNGQKGSGATNGWSFSAGLAFLLDFVDPTIARDADRETGINHTYLFVDFTKESIDDFGSKSSWDLSNDRWAVAGGLLFAF